MTPAPDSQAAFWHAVADQASTWADLPIVRRFAAQLPRNATQRSTGLPGLLQHVTATGGMVASRPLRLGTSVPPMLPLVDDEPSVNPDVLQAWLQDASRVEKVHRVTVAWLRSRLPGYPRLPAPQLARGTPLTTNELTYRLTWTREELAAGLQFQNPPAKPLEALGATAADSKRADEAARRLALALTETTQWQGLQAAEAALSRSDRADLATARKTVTDASKSAIIDAHEPDLALPRGAYRQQIIDQTVSALTGPAREYADAFEAADRLVEFACSDVFGQLAVYGTVALNGVTDLAVHGARPGSVEFTVEDSVYLDSGIVAWLDDPLFADAVYVTGVNHSFDLVHGMRLRATGQAMIGTSAVWPRPDR